MPEAPRPKGEDRFFHLLIAADLSELSKARGLMEEVGRIAQLPEDRIFDLQVAVSEATANAIEHAASAVEIAAWILPDCLIVEITNDGTFQPGLYKDDQHRRRGLGLPLMVSLADQVHVSRLAGGKTQVSLTFFLVSASPPTAPGFSSTPAPASLAPSDEKRPSPGVGRWVWVAIPLLIAAVAVLRVLGVNSSHESAVLLATLNTLLLAASLFIMAFLAARSYLLGGSRALWPLGWGALLLGLSYLLGGLLIPRPNAAVTVSNVGIFLAGACFLLSAFWALTGNGPDLRPIRQVWNVAAPYVGVLAFIGLLTAATLTGVLPEFFAKGHGYTPLRDVFLGLGVLELLTASVSFRVLHRREPSRFLLWCSSGLALIGVALGGVLLTGAVPGSALAWLTRAGGWLGGAFLLVAIFNVEREGGVWVLPLQRALRETEYRYKNLVDLSPDAILVDAEGKHVFANPAAARMLGASSPSELVGREAIEYVHPDDRELVAERMGQVLAGAVMSPRQIRLLRLDGTPIEVEITGSRVEFDGHLATQVVMRDLSPRNEAEQALRQSQQDLAHAQKLSHTGSWRLDLARNELVWSAEAYRIFGIPQGTPLTYELFLAAVHPEDRDFVDRSWTAALGGAPYDIEHRILSGEAVKWVRETAELEFDRGGELAGGFGAVQDITGRKQAEEVRQRNEESLAGVLSTVGRLRVFERQRAWQVFLIGAVLQVALFLGISHLGSPSRYLGIPGAATALIGVIAAIIAGPLTGIAVALAGGAAYIVYLTDFGRSVAWPAIVVSILLWTLAAAVAGLAGEWVRRNAAQREALLGHMLAERETLTDSLGVANEELQCQNEEVAAANEELAAANEALTTLEEELRLRAARLVESEERYRIVADFTYDWEHWLGPDGRFIYMSPSVERVTGHSCEEFMADPGLFLSLVCPEDRCAVKLHLEDLDAAPSNLEFRIVHADGKQRWIEHTCQAVRDGDGRLLGRRGSNRDVTERIRAQEELQQSEERFRTMADAMPQLAWIANADGYIYWYNRRWYEYTGTTLAGMEGWGWQSVHDPEALPAVLARWQGSIATGQPFDMEFPLRGADGLFRPFLTRVMPLKDETGRVLQWFGTNTDVTERKLAEAERERLLQQERGLVEELAAANEELMAQTEELAASEEELRAQNDELQSNRYNRSLIEAALDPLVTIGPDGKITDVNEATIKITGRKREDLIGTDFSDYFTDPERARTGYREVFAEGSVIDYPLTIRGRDGKTTEVHYNASLYKDEEGRVLGVFAAARDITALRELEMQRHIAETLQQTLLDIPEQTGGVLFGHLYRSATKEAAVGGDFYDVLKVKNGRLAILIGDVSGHGVEAARVATLVKDVVHAFAHQFSHPHVVLSKTNDLLIEKRTSGFVTVFLGILDPDTGVLSYSSAGHPNALLRTRSGEVELLEAASAPVGVFPHHSWKEDQVELEKDDLLLLYTDGAIEARRNGQFFGQEGLVKAFERWNDPSPELLPQALLAEVLAFSGGELSDDVAMLALRLVEDAGKKRGNNGWHRQKPAG